jgi:hypothetical protein
MIQNESDLDRFLRVVVGVLLGMYSYSVVQGYLQIVLFVVSGVLVVTSFTGFCSLYKLFGISTLKK